MEFLFFVVLGIILMVMLAPSAPTGAVGLSLKGVEPCPPHKWIYIKVTDPIDRSVRERMVCDKCKHPPGIG